MLTGADYVPDTSRSGPARSPHDGGEPAGCITTRHTRSPGAGYVGEAVRASAIRRANPLIISGRKRGEQGRGEG